MRRHWFLALGLCVLGACAETVAPIPAEGDSESPELQAAVSPLSASTGAMVKARANFTATRLLDGRVLAVGGSVGAADSQTAELYDPATGTWSLTGSLNVARYNHQAVRLPSGRVLVSGGTTFTTNLDLPDEIYDPATGTFTVVGPSVYPASVVIGLADGRVLEARSSSGSRIFDETTGTYTPAALMYEGHSNSTATLLADGRVLVAGGYYAGESSTTVELYNPATNTWSLGKAMTYPRQYASATLLPDGRVLVAGGYGGSSFGHLLYGEIYAPATNTWTLVNINQRRSSHQAALTSTGRVYLFGGSGFAPSMDLVDLVDPVARQTSATGRLQNGRRNFTLTQLGGGQFLLAGGFYDTTRTASAEIYTECTVTSTCADVGAQCGAVTDNCGGTLQCGSCPSGQMCTASNACVCRPTTCRALGKTCGSVSDGCGGTLECGTCGAGADCESNVCSASRTAQYDTTRRAPVCAQPGPSCDSGLLLDGAGSTGPELNAPNTLGLSCTDSSGGTYHSSRSLDRLMVTSLDGASLLAGSRARIEATLWVSAESLDVLDLYATADAATPSWTWLGSLTPVATGAQKLSLEYTLPLGALQAVRGVLRTSGRAPTACSTYWDSDHDDLAFAVLLPPDVTAPTASLTAPTPGQVLSGSVTLTASVADDRGVTKVEYFSGTTLLGTATASPWSLTWNTVASANGSHALTAKAHDAAGNTGTSATVTVTVDNDQTAPTVTVTSPLPGATLRGYVNVTATASDNVGVTLVTFFAGTTSVCSGFSLPASCQWNTSTWANGSYALTARAYDAAGNVGTSEVVTVTLDNDKTPPGVSLTSPTAGATLTGTVTVTASATDAVGMGRVELYDGTALLGTVTGAGPTYSLSWNTVTVANGSHTLRAVAIDAAGNSATTGNVSVTVSNATPGPVLATYDATRKAPACATRGSGCDSGTLLNGRAGLGPEQNAPNTLGATCADGTSGSYHVDESLDALKVVTTDGTPLAPGKTVRIDATVWAYSGYTSDKLDLYYAASATSPSWVYLTTLTPAVSGKQVLSTTYTLPTGALQAVRGIFRYGGSATGACVSGSYNDHDDLVFVTQ